MPLLLFIDIVSWVGLLDSCFLPSEACMAPSVPQKLILREEAFSLVLAQEPLGSFFKVYSIFTNWALMTISGGNQGQ